jgi:hypothetical protein
MAVGGCWKLTAHRGWVGAALLVSRHVAVEVSVGRIPALRMGGRERQEST